MESGSSTSNSASEDWPSLPMIREVTGALNVSCISYAGMAAPVATGVPPVHRTSRSLTCSAIPSARTVGVDWFKATHASGS